MSRRHELKAWRKANPDKVRAANQRLYNKMKQNPRFTEFCYVRHLRWTYGPESVAHYHRCKKRQKGKCVICKKRAKLMFDHCHITKKYRELICRECNSGLGRFKDDVKLLRKAIAYLIKHKRGNK